MVAEYFFPGPNRRSQQSDIISLLTANYHWAQIDPYLQPAARFNSRDNVSSLIGNSRNTLTVVPVRKGMVNQWRRNRGGGYPQRLT